LVCMCLAANYWYIPDYHICLHRETWCLNFINIIKSHYE